MSAGASGGADIEGRAFDAGPTAQMAQNTGSNFPTPIDDALRNTVFGAVTNATWDVYDEQDRQIEAMLQQGLISVDEANQMKGHHLSQQGFLSPLVNALQSPWQMYDQVMDDQNNRPNVSLKQSIIDGFKAGHNNLLGMDYGPQVENKEALDAYLDMIGQPRTSAGVLSQGGIPTSSMQVGPDTTFYSGHIGANNVPHGMRVGPFGYGYLDLTIDPGVNMLDVFGIENQSPTSQQEVDALMNDVLDMQFEDGINFDPDDMSMAMASVEDDPWGYNQSVVDAINASYDTGAISSVSGPEAGGEALAQRAAETIIAQEAARQVTPQSNRVTIPVSSGPNIVIDVTPPAPQKVAPQRRTAPKPSPVKVAAASVARPKAFKKLPKFAQKEIRQGKVPTGGSDYVQDMVRDFLGGQKTVGDSGTRK
jgi:hypothetical protein